MVKFERLVEFACVVPAVPAPVTLQAGVAMKSYLALSRTAANLDSLRERVESGAREMAQRFASYADSLGVSRHVGEPPTGWSTLTELTRDHAKYDALLPVFEELFEATAGKSLYKAAREFAALEDAGREEREVRS